jgi:hypothetical protein
MKKIARSARRRRHLKAWISAEGIPDHQCSVNNVSASGMNIVSMLADKLPKTFTVKFNPTSPNNGPCRVVWRKNFSLGVKFER